MRRARPEHLSHSIEQAARSNGASVWIRDRHGIFILMDVTRRFHFASGRRVVRDTGVRRA